MSEHKLTQTEASLNPPSSELVTIKINGQELQVPKNENLIESAKRIGVDIPYFCYHPRLSKGDAANCRMCLVEVGMPGPDGSIRFMPKPQAACTMPAAPGMVIETESEKVVRDRKGVLEFLLINHPLDCPVCDRGGECPLQNNTLFYGPPTSRYIEEKRHFPKAYPLSDYVVFDRERCIHCARCTRFTEDISGDSQLGFLKRGADMEVGTFAHTAYKSKFSGNVIELCPVGALLSRSYRFKARPWDLHTQQTICTNCSNGCNIKVDYRLEQLQRVNARVNEEVNEEWTCDKGKFGHEYVSASTRIKSPLVRRGDRFEQVTWSEAYEYLKAGLEAAGGRVGGIGGQRSTNEDNYVFQKLFREALKSGNIDCRTGANLLPTQGSEAGRLPDSGMESSIASLETMKSILVIGGDLAEEQPIIFLRVRKAWRYNSAHVISAVTSVTTDTTRVGDFAAAELVYRPGTEGALLHGLLNAMFAAGTVKASPGTDLTALQQSVAEWTPARCAAETGVNSGDLVAAARLLGEGPMAIIAGKEVADHASFREVAAALSNLAIAAGSPAGLNIPGLESNAQGARDMGVLPDAGPGGTPVASSGMNTRQMLEAAATGELQALWITGTDLIAESAEPALVRRALDACNFVVVNALEMNAAAECANLILPVASSIEKDGTMTNCERRVQRLHRCFEISPNIKPEWLVFSEVFSVLTGEDTPYFSAHEVYEDICATVPRYAPAGWSELGDGGVRLAAPPAPAAAPVPVGYTPPRRQPAPV